LRQLAVREPCTKGRGGFDVKIEAVFAHTLLK